MMRTRLPIFSTAIVLIILFPSLLTPLPPLRKENGFLG